VVVSLKRDFTKCLKIANKFQIKDLNVLVIRFLYFMFEVVLFIT